MFKLCFKKQFNELCKYFLFSKTGDEITGEANFLLLCIKPLVDWDKSKMSLIPTGGPSDYATALFCSIKRKNCTADFCLEHKLAK